MQVFICSTSYFQKLLPRLTVRNGACDMAFHAETFDEMAQLSQQHGAEMFQKGDEAHLKAMESMKKIMHDPNAMQQWMSEQRKVFDALPKDK